MNNLDFRRATVADLDAIVAILDVAARWLIGRGIRQWTVPFPRALVEQDLERHRVFVATAGTSLVATASILQDDPLFWGDQPRHSWYLHRLATRRDTPGVGRSLLQWIEHEATSEGVRYVRLDCGRGMKDYYERSGYELQATVCLLHATSAEPRSQWYCYQKQL